MSEDDKPLIYAALNKVWKKVKAVKMANMQRYKARHIYDVYNMLQPILAEEGVLISRALKSDKEKEVITAKGNKGTHRYQVWDFKFTAIDGSEFVTEFSVESIDYGDKASSQCDAMSFKQMLIHSFMIPTQDLQDADDQPEKTHIAHKTPNPTSPHVAPVAPSAAVNNEGFTKGKNAGASFTTVGYAKVKEWVEFMQQKGFTKGADYTNALVWLGKSEVSQVPNHAPNFDEGDAPWPEM